MKMMESGNRETQYGMGREKKDLNVKITGI